MANQASRKSKKLVGVITAVVVVLGALVLLGGWYLLRDIPTTYTSIEDQFKYGSIGNEAEAGVPYWIWKVLPKMFPEKLPGNGYTSLGFILEPGNERPIGFSERIVGIKRVGLNCAVCHTGTVRDTPDSPARIILGMPAHQADVQGYLRFLIACGRDERFTARNVMAAIGEETDLSWLEAALYYLSVPLVKDRILKRGEASAFMDSRPTWGFGRVDTFNPYKVYFNFDMSADKTIGTADLPSLWNQKAREGLWLHWDGDNNSVRERNISASIAVGVTPETLDFESLTRIEAWIWELPPPAFPHAIDQSLAASGSDIYNRSCAYCHAFGSPQVGQVVPKEEIGTDPHRVDSFTPELAAKMNTLGAGHPWQLTHYRKTDGYSNVPLDGLWARAPYLHNGSVPTLWDLLLPVDERPKVFYRGYNVYDREKVGFVSSGPEAEAAGFKLDTSVPGSGNQGHLYGTGLSPDEKKALLEYLKTL
jgi:mono/diheme cytochrome c family protein